MKIEKTYQEKFGTKNFVDQHLFRSLIDKSKITAVSNSENGLATQDGKVVQYMTITVYIELDE